MAGDKYERFLNDLDQVLNKHFGDSWEYRFDHEDDAYQLSLVTWFSKRKVEKKR